MWPLLIKQYILGLFSLNSILYFALHRFTTLCWWLWLHHENIWLLTCFLKDLSPMYGSNICVHSLGRETKLFPNGQKWWDDVWCNKFKAFQIKGGRKSKFMFDLFNIRKRFDSNRLEPQNIKLKGLGNLPRKEADSCLFTRTVTK